MLLLLTVLACCCNCCFCCCCCSCCCCLDANNRFFFNKDEEVEAVFPDCDMGFRTMVAAGMMGLTLYILCEKHTQTHTTKGPQSQFFPCCVKQQVLSQCQHKTPRTTRYDSNSIDRSFVDRVWVMMFGCNTTIIQ